MKKTLLYGLFTLLGVSGGLAAPLTPQQALQRLGGESAKKARSTHIGNRDLVHTFKTDKDVPMMYVFGNKSGYIILSADDSAIPMLGYSDSGEFDEDNISPQMKWWLSEYKRQIEAGSNYNMKAPSRVVGVDPSWTAIDPLVKTKWDQDAPYFNDCPKTSDGAQTYTGCVATAMAQVMKYWNYPEKGTGRVSYQCDRLGGRTLFMSFGSQNPFDWANMLDVYEKGKYNDEQAAAVALLMKCCGYSVEMSYGSVSSGAQSYKIPLSMIQYFNYSKNTRIEARDIYSVSEWAKMIYDNLKNVGPVIYDGQSMTDGGHSFICDGYDGNGYFHFNWGWSGMSDGYFALNALDPSALGIGGGGGGFDFMQDAILGIQPADDQPVVAQPAYLYQNGNLVGTMSGATLSFDLNGQQYPYWMSYTNYAAYMKFGAIAEPVEGTSGETLYIESNINPISFSSYGSGIYQKSPSGNSIIPRVSLNAIKEGKYKVTLATMNQYDSSAGWEPVRPQYGYSNHVFVTRTGNTFKVENLSPLKFTVKNFTLDSELYSGCMAKFELTLQNNTSVDLSQGIMPVIFVGGEQSFVGDSWMEVIAAGQNIELTLVTKFDALQGTPSITTDTPVEICLLNPVTNELYDDASIETVMKKNPGEPMMRMLEIGLDAEKDNGVYIVNDRSNINLSTKIQVLKGYFAYPLYALILDDTGGILFRQSIGGDDLTFMTGGSTYNFDVKIDFSSGKPDVKYPLYVAYQKNYDIKVIGAPVYFTINGDSGVADVVSDNEISTLYDKASKTLSINSAETVSGIISSDLNGLNAGVITKVSSNEYRIDYSNDGSQIIILRIIGENGKCHSCKIAI